MEKKEEKQAILDAYEYTIEDVPLCEIIVDDVEPEIGFEKSHKNLGHASNVDLNKLTTLQKEKSYTVINGRKTINTLLHQKKESVKARVYKNLPGKVCNMVLLVKNLQQSPSPIVEAEAIKELMDRDRMTMVDISEITGINPSVLSQRLSLLDLPKVIQEQLRKNTITYSVARKVRSLPKDVQNKIAKEESITGEVVEKYHREHLNSMLSFDDLDLPRKIKGPAEIKNYIIKLDKKEEKVTRKELISRFEEIIAGLKKEQEFIIKRI